MKILPAHCKARHILSGSQTLMELGIHDQLFIFFNFVLARRRQMEITRPDSPQYLLLLLET